jgi:cytochrome b6-f complex iron-sulfur subunit
MFRLARTIFGLVVGWLAAALLAVLGRFQQSGPLAAKTQRRTFVRNATLGATAATLGVLGAGFGLLMWPNKTGAFGSEITIPDTEVPPVKGNPYRDIQGKFYLVHNEDGLLALYQKCPHLGCTVPWVGPWDSPEAFHCPCHGSMYDHNGTRTGGPAPRSMDLMRVTVEKDNTVKVDTGEITQRAKYQKSQATPFNA